MEHGICGRVTRPSQACRALRTKERTKKDEQEKNDGAKGRGAQRRKQLHPAPSRQGEARKEAEDCEEHRNVEPP